jgi:hypothetical protein
VVFLIVCHLALSCMLKWLAEFLILQSVSDCYADRSYVVKLKARRLCPPFSSDLVTRDYWCNKDCYSSYNLITLFAVWLAMRFRWANHRVVGDGDEIRLAICMYILISLRPLKSADNKLHSDPSVSSISSHFSTHLRWYHFLKSCLVYQQEMFDHIRQWFNLVSHQAFRLIIR